MTRILILGGTREAAELAAELTRQSHEVITSLAGRTKEPRPIDGKVRIGGFGGIQGLVKYLRDNNIEKLIDATHPFARRISVNALAAVQDTGIPFEQRTRPPWQKHPKDIWINVPDIEHAVHAIPYKSIVLLALGSQYITPFTKRDDVRFIIRMIDPPVKPLSFNRHELLLARPSAEWLEERDLLKRHGISHIVCRNSGGKGAYAKIEAARDLSISVIMIDPAYRQMDVPR